MINKIKQAFINTGRWIKGNIKKVLVAAGIIGVALAAGEVGDTPTIPSVDVNGEVIKFAYTDNNYGEDLIIRTDKEKIHGTTYVMIENKSGTPQDVELSAFFGDERHKVKDIYKLAEDMEHERILPVYETSTQDCSYTNTSTDEFIKKDCVVKEQTGTTSQTYYVDEWQKQSLEDFSELSYQSKVVDKKINTKSKRGFAAKKKLKEKISDKSYYKIEIQYPLKGEEDHEFFLEAIGSEGAYGHLDPWLGTWAYRQKLTIDNTKIDDDLTHFPVTVFLSNDNGSTSEIFNEVGSASTNIAFTSDDEETQLYGEIESWDESASTAVIHVSKTGWEVASSTDTDFYIYYDSTEDANTTYIGNDADDTPSNNVWDSNYVFVDHLKDITTSTTKDSTDNSNDGTKKGANEPNETTGKIAKGQDFDGSDDYIEMSNDATLNPSNITMEAWVYQPDTSDNNDYHIIHKPYTSHTSPYYQYVLGLTSNGHNIANRLMIFISDGNFRYAQSNANALTAGTWNSIAGRYDGSDIDGFVDGTEIVTSSSASGDIASYTTNLRIGNFVNIDRSYPGKIDEVRISNTARSDAWLKASYNTQKDDFLTYGTEEEASAEEGEQMEIIIISYLWQKNGK